MNKLFLKVIMPLLFLQVMFMVSASAQITQGSGTPRVTSTPVSTTITFPSDLAPAEKAIVRLTELANTYAIQRNALPEPSPMREILSQRIRCVSHIARNLGTGSSIQESVSVPYAIYLKQANQSSISAFKLDLELAFKKF